MVKKLTVAQRKTKNFFERFIGWAASFLGSWWAIIFHTAWFTLWLILDFDVNLLTFSVSLEAIFIGIFLLMSANRAEVKRDIQEAIERSRDRERLERDIKLDEKAEKQLREIRQGQEEIRAEMKEIKKRLDGLS